MPGPDPNARPSDPYSCAWVTLITRSSYLPGAVLLVHTLYKHESKHPMIVQYTSALPQDCIDCLRHLQKLYPLLHTQNVPPVPLPAGLTPISPRFDDTLTKLRVFKPLDEIDPPPEPKLRQTPTQVCFLDADMAIFRNLDDIFTIPRPSSDWIAAHHACICNIDNDPWAPPEWNKDNCPSTPLQHPSALDAPIPSSSAGGARPTYQMLNSGVFVCSPSEELWDRIEHFRTHDKRVTKFAFPDQNFLDEFFRDHWVPIGWQYNAFKTHRYWHSSAWRDDEVRALHYIVDKPWESQVKDDGTAGYLGRDGVTHSWWWKEFHEWQQWMDDKGAKDVSDCVNGYVLVDSKLGETRYEK
ncbi:hypothetical protein LTR37_006763 [Vermiconidia calcicola]|uniref:Uncharacterized protein n=1 Tax=Vermiconidia calcicola TaxID=1690605 RepID=A0ACC3NFU9_9PEZI|nr:hypothetical protein LTR37_006763 [Vermiconidia calcicola]